MTYLSVAMRDREGLLSRECVPVPKLGELTLLPKLRSGELRLGDWLDIVRRDSECPDWLPPRPGVVATSSGGMLLDPSYRLLPPPHTLYAS